MAAGITFVFLLVVVYVNGLQVNTTEGPVEGYRAADGDYFVFFGIPYAGPTSGIHRYKAPTPPPPRATLFQAIGSNIICAQPTDRGLVGIEDCLTLTISTRNTTTPKPVIVWLNSEEYTTSNTRMFSSKRFVEEDVVFVSVNFRLSIFGFLCLGVNDAPGNAGLKDVVQALKWVNSNIANFGGNPDNVVLMGHGSGAAMVDLLTMSQQTKGLIHKAVALSGSGLAPWAVAYDPAGYAGLLGARLGYGGKSREDLAKHLLLTDIGVLQVALREFSFRNNTPLFAPCIENSKLNSNDTILLDAPINLLKAGKYLQIPYIAGYTSLEGTMRASEAAFGKWLDGMQTNFSEFVQVDLDLRNNRTAVVAAIREFYFSQSPISMGTIEDFLDYQGDTLIKVSVIRGAQERSLSSTAEVRLLEFAYLGTLNSDWIYNQIPLSGVRHGGLLNYFFDFDLRPADEVVMRSIVKRFVAFASTGSPNVVTPRTSQWTPITKDQLNYFYYGGSDELQTVNQTIHVEEPRFNPHNITMNFWNDILARYYVAPKSLNSGSMGTFSGVLLVVFSQFLMHLF